MTRAPRCIAHPGRAAADRIDSFGGGLQRLEFELEPGLSFSDAIAKRLQAAEISSAGLELTDFSLWPFRYVVPAFSRDADHVAFYSETFQAAQPTRIETARATFGFRDERPFVHCHALWQGQDGAQRGGHVLPFESVIAGPGRVAAFGCEGVAMVAQPDPETNFTLFGPVATAKGGSGTRNCIIARIRPNEDLVESIEAVCRKHGVTRAEIRSGIGSIVGAIFGDGKTITEIPTEILITAGRVTPDASGNPTADIEIALIDTQGRIHNGKPARGLNPILICLELVLEVAS